MQTMLTDILQIARPYVSAKDEENIASAYDLLRSQKSEEVQNTLQIITIAAQELNIGGKGIVCLLLYPLYASKILQQSDIIPTYGQKAYSIVESVAKILTIDTSKSNLQSENFIKLILSQIEDIRVILILIALKLYKLRTIDTQNPIEQKFIAEELSSLYAPISHRLGLYNIKTEMEEMSMKVLHTDMYKLIAKKIAQKKQERDDYIQSFIAPLQKIITDKGLQVEVKGRPKSIYSIWNKIKKNNVSFENIYDLFAIRIIIESKLEDEKSDCWNVYSLISDIYRPNPKRLRDWISSPKQSGYESLHTTVLGPENKWVEVQIRTRRMDDIAERGYAAHWKYKNQQSSDSSTDWLSNIRQILEQPDSTNLDDENNSRVELYTNEIFIFTPQGDLRKMNPKSTVLDFAYDIHGKLGDTCVGAKVNTKVVPIKHILQNGDRVEILTSKTQNPKQDWLSFVTTSKARQRIKKYIKEIEYKDAEIGKEFFIRKFTQHKVKFGDDNIHKLIRFYNVKTALDLYLGAAQNKIDLTQVKVFFESLQKNELDAKAQPVNTKEYNSRMQKIIQTEHANLLLIDSNLSQVDYTLATCCNPIKGDDIFGFINAKGGVKIHRLQCSNAINMLNNYPYRIIKAKWNNTENPTEFLVSIKVVGSDNLAILNTVTQIITKEISISIRNFNISSSDGNFEGIFELYISDKEQLQKILEKIKKVKGVFLAERYLV